MALATRVAVVTGGGSGIGRATSVALARTGCEVAIFDLNPAGGEETAALVRAEGRRALAVEVDVSRSDSVAAGVARVHETLGRVGVLVTSAGVGEFALLEQMTEAQWDRMLGIHLKGTFNCVKAVAPDLTAAGWGRIVCISSVAGLTGGGPGLSHYAAAKGGIVAFARALSQELGRHGVTVNVVAPGMVDTPMIAAAGVAEELYEDVVRRTPVGRLGKPADIAAACVYLASDDAGFVTGQVLSPNGGVHTS
jgi:NAD(P)-dependent dehydrogenase (short-subunit alcohol dehydrogenase family)